MNIITYLIIIINLLLSKSENTFKPYRKGGSCEYDEMFHIFITGYLSSQTTKETKWIPTFSSPENPTVSCSMEASSSKTSTIDCFISSPISNSDVVITKLTADDFNDVIFDEKDNVIEYNVSCKSFFLKFSKELLLFLLIFT